MSLILIPVIEKTPFPASTLTVRIMVRIEFRTPFLKKKKRLGLFYSRLMSIGRFERKGRGKYKKIMLVCWLCDRLLVGCAHNIKQGSGKMGTPWKDGTERRPTVYHIASQNRTVNPFMILAYDDLSRSGWDLVALNL